MASSQPVYRMARWSFALAFISITLAFLVFAANVHSGSRFWIGHLIELSLLWPALLPRPSSFAGLPAFIAWLLLAFVGYFALYLSLLVIARWVRTFFVNRA